ncbi:transposase [Oceanobacillus profundus]|uniref:transposase n=1 Tax=Oceanobacillus TaxID=182709 RepID=UPI0026E406BD|nr:transposase [Oceanobacillus profundus]MDO6451893.1 transposase [Oceanobacillus profundus]
MGTIMALDVTMGKSYKVVYDGQNCLSEEEVTHDQIGFQELMNEIQSLPEDLMLVFESTGMYSRPVETFCQKKSVVLLLIKSSCSQKALEQGCICITHYN